MARASPTRAPGTHSPSHRPGSPPPRRAVAPDASMTMPPLTQLPAAPAALFPAPPMLLGIAHQNSPPFLFIQRRGSIADKGI